MKVNINRDKIINGYCTRDIVDIEVEEYSLIRSALDYRLEILEEKLEKYKTHENLKEFIPKIEKQILQLKSLIEKLGG